MTREEKNIVKKRLKITATIGTISAALCILSLILALVFVFYSIKASIFGYVAAISLVIGFPMVFMTANYEIKLKEYKYKMIRTRVVNLFSLAIKCIDAKEFEKAKQAINIILKQSSGFITFATFAKGYLINELLKSGDKELIKWAEKKLEEYKRF